MIRFNVRESGRGDIRQVPVIVIIITTSIRPWEELEDTDGWGCLDISRYIEGDVVLLLVSLF